MIKRVTVLLIAVFMAFGGLSIVSAHEWISPKDGKNPNHPLDLKRVYLSHNDRKLFFSIETYGGFTNRMLRTNGTFQTFIWKRRPGHTGYFGAAVYKGRYGLVLKVVKFTPDGKKYIAGYGKAYREDTNAVGFSVKRSLVGADGHYIRWQQYSRWGTKWNDEGKCQEDCREDHLPERRGNFYHNLDQTG